MEGLAIRTTSGAMKAAVLVIERECLATALSLATSQGAIEAHFLALRVINHLYSAIRSAALLAPMMSYLKSVVRTPT